MSDLAQRLQEALADRYRIERELGRGGMATVFLAEDLKHRRQVAIKVLDPEIAAAIGPERFLREIETVARLSHPNILPLFDSGEAGRLLYYVMPYVSGGSLRERLERERQLPLEDALRLAAEVASALGAAHRQGVVHRDIKPENLLLESGHAIVADFGIARAIAAADGPRLTTTGVMVGTPAYMSPEQVAGSRELDGRSDVYNLGAVLYEMLAGQPPFTGPTLESVAHQHLNVVPHPVSALRSAVPAAVDRAVARALAKSPADRFPTTDEFARALAGATSTAATLEAPRTGRRPRRLAVAALAVGLVLAYGGVAAWQAWWPFGGTGGPPPVKKDWLLVAEFTAPPGDSTLAPAARSLLSAALDQSRIVATVPQDEIRRALVAAGRPGNSRVDPALARELAYRSAVRAVLEGEIGRIGRGYSIVVRVVAADTSRVLLTERATAKDEDALIPALGRLATTLRRDLGEHRGSLRATRPMALAATPSFEAYKLYLQGATLYFRQSENRRAIALYRAALAIDPDFATAWEALAYPYANLGYPDSQLVVIQEALRRSDRLSPDQRARLAILRARAEGDFAGAAAALDRMVEDDPTNTFALGADALWDVGRFEDALERNRRVMRLRPFGPRDGDWINLAADLMYLGRFDEAREATSHQSGIWREFERQLIEKAACRFAAAESIATSYQNDQRLEADSPGGNALDLADLHLARGAFRSAATEMSRSEQLARAASDVLVPGTVARERVQYACLSDGVFPWPSDAWARDTSATGLISRGLLATCVGDSALARRCLANVRRRPARTWVRQGAGPALLEARIALMQGRPEETVRILRPLSQQRVEIGLPPRGVGLVWVRWTLADAFERSGRLDSAAVHLERNLTLPFMETKLWPLVHRRLVLLYARMGRAADAERHLVTLERLWDRPDPEVRRLLDQARTAVEGAKGMARPSPQS